jgi:hypothetical protein
MCFQVIYHIWELFTECLSPLLPEVGFEESGGVQLAKGGFVLFDH